MTTKSRTTIKDKARVGELIDKGCLDKLFTNPVFIGVAACKGDKVHRYYVNTASMKVGKDACSRSRSGRGSRRHCPGAQNPASPRGRVTGHPGRAGP